MQGTSQQQQQQQMQPLASAAEVAAAESYLQSQGNDTRLVPPLDGCQCLLSSPYSAVYHGEAISGSSATQQQQQREHEQQQQQVEVVVPLGARSQHLSMAKLIQVTKHAPCVVPTVGTVECQDDSGASSATGVSLAIVDGVDVVQLKLFPGIQPPSEKY